MSDHDHGHHHDSDHHHGHQHDHGLKGLLRYLRFLPSMWRSDVNNAVVERVAPASGDIVVDIGAGMGSGVVPAARTGATVIAVEPTNYMRAILNARKMVQRARKQISVTEGTAEQLGLPDSSATVVIAVNAMHHWSDMAAASGEIARILKPGGRIFLVDEQFRDPEHPDFTRHDESHDVEFEQADLDKTVNALTAAGLGSVEGSYEKIADVPVLAFSATKG